MRIFSTVYARKSWIDRFHQQTFIFKKWHVLHVCSLITCKNTTLVLSSWRAVLVLRPGLEATLTWSWSRSHLSLDCLRSCCCLGLGRDDLEGILKTREAGHYYYNALLQMQPVRCIRFKNMLKKKKSPDNHHFCLFKWIETLRRLHCNVLCL